MTICERMFQIIEEKGKKTADLCRILEIGTGQTTTWKKRNTDPPAKYITQICEFLEVTPEYLLTGKECSNLNLTENEKEMLQHFKKLSERGQIETIGFVKGKLSEQVTTEQKSLISKIG